MYISKIGSAVAVSAFVLLAAAPLHAANVINEDSTPYALTVTQEPGTESDRTNAVIVPAGNSLDNVCPDNCTLILNGASMGADDEAVIVIRDGKLQREG